MGRTCEFIAAGGDVVVALAIRRCCVLLKELQIRKGRGIDGCCFMILVTIFAYHVRQAL